MTWNTSPVLRPNLQSWWALKVIDATLTVTPIVSARMAGTVTADASLDASPAIAAAARFNPAHVQASETVTPSLVAAGHRITHATESLSVTPTITATAHKIMHIDAALSVTPTIAATMGYKYFANASVTVTPTVASSATVTSSVVGNAALTVTPSLVSSISITKHAGVSVTFTPTFSATGQRTTYATESLSVTPAMSAAALVTKHAASALSVSPTFSASAQKIIHGAPALTVTPSFAAAATVTPGAVTYLDAGAGNYQHTSSTSASTSWSHTISGTANCVIVGLWVATETSPTNFTRTVTVGGTSMTSAGIQNCTNTQWSSGYGFMEFFYLLNPPTGTQTVSVSVSGSTVYFMCGNSMSYSGVGTIGSVGGQNTTTSSTALSQTVSAATNAYIIQSFVDYRYYFLGSSASLTGYNQNQRLNESNMNGSTSWASGTDAAYILGDAAGGTSVSFTATANASTGTQGWASAYVVISP